MRDIKRVVLGVAADNLGDLANYSCFDGIKWNAKGEWDLVG